MMNEELRIEKKTFLHSPFSILNFALALPALFFLAIFFVYPLVEIAQVSFTPSEISRGENPLTVLRDPSYAQTIWFSLWQAALSTALTLAAGLPAAYAFARYRFPGQWLWRVLAVVPFVLPTVVVAAAFSALLGPRGVVNGVLQAILNLDQPPIRLLGTLPMILIAHVFYNFGVVMRLVGGFLIAFSPRIEEAAASLGANRWQTLRLVTLPMAMPAIGAAAALIFLFNFTSFGVVLILGGARFATIEVEIYRQTSQMLRLDVATSLALVQMAFTLALGVISTQLEARTAVQQELQIADTRQPPKTFSSRALVIGSVTFIAVLLMLPLIMLFVKSLDLGGGDPLHYYVALNENTRNSFFFVPPLDAIRNSLVFALITAALAMALGLPLAYVLSRKGSRGTRLLDALLLLPLGASAVTLGLGFLVALDQPPLDLRTSVLLLPIAHTLIALPFVVRALAPAMRSFDPRLREIARSLGASSLQVLFLIELPLLAAPFVGALIFAFTISLGEFGAALLIARPEYPTMPLVIYRFLGQPGALNYGQALAMSSLLMLVTAGSVFVIERVNTRALL
jgi:thiamine transport system permease protein